MSNILTVAPVLDLNLEHKDVLIQGAEDISVKQWFASSYSNSSITFSCPPPSLSTFIDRAVLLSIPVVINYAGTTTGSALLQNGFDALRAYPISSILSNCQATINNQTFSLQTKQIVPYIAHYFKECKHTNFPSFLDKFAVYADGTNAVNNPLGSYLNSVDGFQPRGGFPMIVVNGSTSASITATITEPIMMPPFHMELQSGLGFSNVNSMSITCNFASTMSRIVSHALSNATLSSVSVTINQPILTMQYFTPKIGYIPRPLRYGSQEIVAFPTQYSSALSSNASAVITSSNIQLNAIPSHLYVFVREADINLDYTKTDTFCNISGINLTFNNVTGILSSATEVDIFNIAKNNGLRDSWVDWHGFTSVLGGSKIGTTGSILKLCFGKDITLHSDNFVGQQGAFNLQLNVTATNYNQSASITNPTLVIIAVTPSCLTFHETGQIENRLGVLPNQDSQYVPYSHVWKHYGGSFMDVVNKVSGFVKPVGNFLRSSKLISNVASMIPHPVAQNVANVARSFGFDGEDGEGGRVLSRQQLKSRLRRL
jgi:hypothetical protein